MGRPNSKHQPPDRDEALRAYILDLTQEMNRLLIMRLQVVHDDLEANNHRSALGGLDGIERDINTLRSFLLLVP